MKSPPLIRNTLLAAAGGFSLTVAIAPAWAGIPIIDETGSQQQFPFAEGKTPVYPGIPADSLERFGGQAGVDVWVDDLFKYILADNRINQIFISHGHVQRQMALNKELESMVLGGPVKYSGASMSAAHADLGITVTQFNAVVEDAYLACDDARVPYHVCNQLIAALAPFERAIVTR
jgi:hemoglobin